MITLDVTGFKEMERTLLKLPAKLSRQALRKAALAGANVIKREAKARVPVETGRLKKGIIARMKRGLPHNYIAYDVGLLTGGSGAAKAKDAYYGVLVEFGTRPHKIEVARYRVTRQMRKWGKTSRGRGARVLANKGAVFGRVVHHPGMAPRPFMRPAFDQSHQKVIAAIRKKLASELAKVVR